MHLLPLRSCLQLLALASASASLAVTNDFLSVLERADAAAVRNDESTALYVFLSALSPHPDAEYALRRIADLSPDAASRAQLTNTLNSCLALLDLPAQRIAISLLASLCRSLGDSAAAQSYFAALAPLTNWLIVGGFDNAERAGLTTRFPPEFRLGCRETYQGKQWPVRWRPALPLRHNFGVDLQLIRPTSWLTAYLRTGLLAPTTTCALLIIDFPGAFRLWLNGQPLAEETQYREPHNEMYFVPLTLREGTNLIVAKLCSSHNNVTFLTRLALPNGTPLFLHSLQPDDATIPLSCQTTSQWPRPLPSPGVRRWEAAFLANSNDQHTALMLARYYACLLYT
ncbi:MAG: hypothetical protein N2595_03270, partial [bacterium]|nr:hypothetical protein [bacterium]